MCVLLQIIKIIQLHIEFKVKIETFSHTHLHAVVCVCVYGEAKSITFHNTLKLRKRLKLLCIFRHPFPQSTSFTSTQSSCKLSIKVPSLRKDQILVMQVLNMIIQLNTATPSSNRPAPSHLCRPPPRGPTPPPRTTTSSWAAARRGAPSPPHCLGTTPFCCWKEGERRSRIRMFRLCRIST